MTLPLTEGITLTGELPFRDGKLAKMGAIPILYNIYNETRRTTGVQGSLTPPFAVSGTRLRKAPRKEVLSSVASHLMHRTTSDGGAA